MTKRKYSAKKKKGGVYADLGDQPDIKLATELVEVQEKPLTQSIKDIIEKKGKKKKKGPSAWNLHVRKVASENKGKTWKQIIQLAKASYKVARKVEKMEAAGVQVEEGGAMKKKGKKGGKRKPTAWNIHVSKTKKENPDMKFKDVLKKVVILKKILKK